MSEVKVNKISPRSDCGTVTLGDSGDTFTIPSGATITNNGTQTGFGRTGTVDWQTGSIKTTGFTAATGEGYFCNTTAAAFTCTLPAGAAGSIVSVQDYANTFDTYALTLTPDGSEKINGGAGSISLATEGEGLTLVYIDSTQGWRSVQDNDTGNVGSNYISASGGNTTITCGDYKNHIFTGPGTLTVSAAGSPAGSDSVEYLVVAGGGGGGGNPGGPSAGDSGAGGGGWRSRSALPTVAPTNAPANLPVTATDYPITVGGGGPGGPGSGTIGSDSIFSSITSAGGGYGSHAAVGGNGGSGGGSPRDAAHAAGSGNSPPVSPVQGYDGGTPSPAAGPYRGASGGGGGGQIGQSGTGGSNPTEQGGAGGAGAYLSDPFIGPTAPSYGTPGPVGSTRYFSGGGGGGFLNPVGAGAGAGGAGGGGAGAEAPGPTGTAGTVNTGGGGGGAGVGGAGGSGIVIIRYKFQN